ncbi:hypothetical protein H696_04195 [Fonticula alba]|uniref:NAD-dependent epimerase/dehydratase domain-containing protein n=1 Tax=Fonticula alba TaxID=691883 RepID=A0A058Z3R0_FONAL|nr:hypothetical protein H696_04195 [Fonticula alba]KCV68776.1 hypothetical protein H696_04195 [Fonticula alba]|eukprot:XP_009496347.1 hypothetical protein H696_04195 [Fonticula alba]
MSWAVNTGRRRSGRRRAEAPMAGERAPRLGWCYRPVIPIPTADVDAAVHYGRGRSSVSGHTVTIFGASGLLGLGTVHRFARIGSTVRTPYRGDHYDIRHLKVMGDLGQVVQNFYCVRDKDRVAQLVEGSDIVINLIGRDYETANFKFEDINIDAPRTIAEACKKAGVKRLVHVSHINADADSEAKQFSTKRLGELAVLSEFPEASIVRPSTMYGYDDRFLRWIAHMNRNVLFPGDLVVNGGETVFYPTYAGDVAQAIQNIAVSPNSSGKVYELVGPKKYTYNEILQIYSDTTGAPISPLNVPAPIFKAILRMYELLPSNRLASRSDVYRLSIDETPTPGALGFGDVGVVPAELETMALRFLRPYRVVS